MRAGEVPRPGKFPALDDFRWIAVILVVANHTRSAEGPFLWLLTVLRRVAVPYFLMVSGYFLGRDGWRSTGRFLKRTALLYGVGVLLYLPLNWYAGQLSPDFPRQVVFDGSFYHLWYLPALLLGTPAAWLLSRLGRRKALLIAGGLYLIGLGGDSYYGLLPEGVTGFYDVVFQVFTYTRNGLFYVPLFLLLGAAGVTLGRRVSLAGFLISLSMLVSEALLLRGAGVQRFDSMYVCFPFLMVFLFSLLLNANRGERRELRRLTTLRRLAPGTYEVRYAATASEMASQVQKVTIAKGGSTGGIGDLTTPGSKLSLLNRKDHIAYIAGRTNTQKWTALG